jgi:small subunit ribosomal protein S1
MEPTNSKDPLAAAEGDSPPDPSFEQPEETSFAELFESRPSLTDRKKLQPGDAVQGKVVLITRDTVFIDFGYKAEGWATIEDFLDAEGQSTIAVGSEVSLTLIEYTPSGAHLGSSLRKAFGTPGRELLQRAYEADIPVEGLILKVNKGGLEVDIGGARAFCPLSQIDLHYCENPEALIGTNQKFQVLRIEEEGRNVLLSRRAVLQAERETLAAKVRETLALGAVLDGTVTRLTSFGAFVDLGGLEGLLHVSEISRQQVADPADRLQTGQSVKVQVLRLEQGEKGEDRISLSMKSLEPDPWQEELPFQEGALVSGQVRHLTPYGAFVELTPGLEGLIHISEISDRRIAHPQQVLSPGETVTVMVLEIDRDRQRVSLSLKAGAPPAEHPAGELSETRTGDVIRRGRRSDNLEAEDLDSSPLSSAGTGILEDCPLPAAPVSPLTPRVGLITRGIIRTVKPYGLFLDLPELGSRMRGLLHQSNLATGAGSSLKGLKEGEELEVEIIKIDELGRISLSQQSVIENRERSELKHYLGQDKGSGALGTMADLFKKINKPG